MDRLRSAFNRVVSVKTVKLFGQKLVALILSTLYLFLQIKNKQYSRFTLHSTEDGEGHAEIKLSDDSAEADDQVDESPSFRPAVPHQHWRNLCIFVLGMLLIFCIGRIIIVMRNVVFLNLQFTTFGNTCMHTHLTVVSLVLQAT